MSYHDVIRQIVAEELDRRTVTDRRMGTVVTRDPGIKTGSDAPGQHEAGVVLDGDSTAVPMFVPATVRARPGDRVLAASWGGDTSWFVLASFGRPVYGSHRLPVYGWSSTAPGVTYSTTSASYAQMGITSTYFGKEHDFTTVEFSLALSAQTTLATNTKAMFGVRLTNRTTGAVTEYDVTDFFFNAVTDHLTVAGWRTVTGIGEGEYDAILIWKRVSGTASVNFDSNDRYALRIEEMPVAYYDHGA